MGRIVWGWLREECADICRTPHQTSEYGTGQEFRWVRSPDTPDEHRKSSGLVGITLKKRTPQEPGDKLTLSKEG